MADGDAVGMVEVAGATPPVRERRAHWVARVGWAVLAVAVAVVPFSTFVGWTTTAKVTFDRCGIPESVDGTYMWMSGIRHADGSESWSVLAGTQAEVHHRLFRANTYTFLAADGTRVPLHTHGGFGGVPCTGGPG